MRLIKTTLCALALCSASSPGVAGELQTSAEFERSGGLYYIWLQANAMAYQAKIDRAFCTLPASRLGAFGEKLAEDATNDFVMKAAKAGFESEEIAPALHGVAGGIIAMIFTSNAAHCL